MRLAQKEGSRETALRNIGQRVLTGRIPYESFMVLSKREKNIFFEVFRGLNLPTNVVTEGWLLNKSLADLAQRSTDPDVLATLCQNTHLVGNPVIDLKRARPLVSISEIAAQNPKTRQEDAAYARAKGAK
jgi:hypothetical protein